MEAFIPIVLFLSVAGVIILRPISSKLGSLLEAMARERQPTQQVDSGEVARIRVLVEHIAKRVDLMEERLDFTERLLTNSRHSALGSAPRLDSLAREREGELLQG